MPLDGLGTDEQHLGDFLAGVPFGDELEDLLLTRGQQPVAFVGLTTLETPEIASPGPNVNFLPYDNAQEEIDALTEQGINKIILLTHTGYDEDQAVAALTDGAAA